MQYFDDFDPEDKNNKEFELNTLEKGTVTSILSVIELLVKKAINAKTYNDLYIVMDKIAKFVEDTDELMKDASSDANLEDVLEVSVDIESVTNDPTPVDPLLESTPFLELAKKLHAQLGHVQSKQKEHAVSVKGKSLTRGEVSNREGYKGYTQWANPVSDSSGIQSVPPPITKEKSFKKKEYKP
jgi:hypothetical protein